MISQKTSLMMTSQKNQPKDGITKNQPSNDDITKNQPKDDITKKLA